MFYFVNTLHSIFPSVEGHVGSDHLFVITNCPTRNSLEVASLYTFGRLSLGSGSQSGALQPHISITRERTGNANSLPPTDLLNHHTWEGGRVKKCVRQ